MQKFIGKNKRDFWVKKQHKWGRFKDERQLESLTTAAKIISSKFDEYGKERK